MKARSIVFLLLMAALMSACEAIDRPAATPTGDPAQVATFPPTTPTPTPTGAAAVVVTIPPRIHATPAVRTPYPVGVPMRGLDLATPTPEIATPTPHPTPRWTAHPTPTPPPGTASLSDREIVDTFVLCMGATHFPTDPMPVLDRLHEQGVSGPEMWERLLASARPIIWAGNDVQHPFATSQFDICTSEVVFGVPDEYILMAEYPETMVSGYIEWACDKYDDWTDAPGYEGLRGHLLFTMHVNHQAQVDIRMGSRVTWLPVPREDGCRILGGSS